MKKFLCKIIKHSYVDIGACPYTAKSYMGCVRCEKVIEKH